MRPATSFTSSGGGWSDFSRRYPCSTFHRCHDVLWGGDRGLGGGEEPVSQWVSPSGSPSIRT